jgi:hypothetical protein
MLTGKHPPTQKSISIGSKLLAGVVPANKELF